MADEQVIGVAQLRLEADADDLIRGLRQTADEVDKAGASFGRLTEKGEKEGASLLNAQARLNSEIASLTETATQRQIRAVDERAAQVIARSRSRGVAEEEIAKYEIAVHQRKHAILVADEKRTADVLAAEGQKKVTTLQATERAAGSSHAAFNKTQTAVQHLGMAFGGTAGEAGKVTGALGHLVAAGLNPVALSAAALALTIGTVIKKHEQEAEAAIKAAEAYEGKMRAAYRFAGEMAVLRGQATNADLVAKEREIATLEESARNIEQQILNARAGSGDVAAAKRELDARLAAIEALREEVFVIRAKAEAEEEASTRAAEKARWDALKAQGEKERAADAIKDRESLFQHEKRRKEAIEEMADFDKQIAAAVKDEIAAEKEALAVLEQKNEVVERAIELKEELARPKDKGLFGPLSVNGRGDTNQTTASLYQAAYGAGGSSAIDVGAIMRNRQGTSVVVNNFAPVGVTARQGRDGRVEITIADDILNGGDTARAIEDAYGLQRGGSGR